MCLKPRQLTLDNYQQACGHSPISIIECMILFGHTDNQGILLGDGELWGSSFRGSWFSSWYVVSIDTGRIAQSPQSGPRWSPAFKIEPVLFPPSIVHYDNQEVDTDTIHGAHSCVSIYNALICVCACLCMCVCVAKQFQSRVAFSTTVMVLNGTFTTRPLHATLWLGSQNRKQESKMAVAKRQGREKPAKIEQRKVRGPSEDLR